jgi:aryl-alcohol dehydrogenase-like predicted oxidoreductase
MKNKIILGSANFDQTYGIKRNFIKKDEIKKMLNYANKNKIKIIDTSPLYNKSEKIIGLLNNNRFRIISKIPQAPKKIEKKNIYKWLKKTVMISLKNLKIKSFEYLLFHNSNSLLDKNADEIYKSIIKIKNEGFTKKIGISIYDVNILKKILKKFRLDLIQVPFNILDQRLLKKNLLKTLKKKGIEIHVRSIFLQGILLLKHTQLPYKLKKFSKIWMIWERWLKKNKLDPLQACFSFAYNQQQINGIIIGCNNKRQLQEVVGLKKEKNIFLPPRIKIKNKKLIDPRTWSK